MATAKKQLVIAQVGAATALVQAGNILGAHDALKVIADNEGDGALKEALQKVPPSDLGQILVGTATLPSAILAELVTPEPFLKALLEVPKNWTPENEEDALLQLQELFLGVVMRPDEDGTHGADASKFLKAIRENEMAAKLLGLYLDKKVKVLVDADGDVETWHDCIGQRGYEFHEGDWDHLAYLAIRTKGLDSMLKAQWKKVQPFESFLPRIVTSKAVQSALGCNMTRGAVSRRLLAQNIDEFDVLNEE